MVGLDVRGQVLVCVSTSGKWTPRETVDDREWLGALAHAEADPRAPGPELHAGGQRGNLYQVRAYPHGALDKRPIARLPGREIHAVVAGELDAEDAPELLVFTPPGALFQVTPTGPHGAFESKLLQELLGRARGAARLPAGPGEPSAAARGDGGRIVLLARPPGFGVAAEGARK